MSTVPRFMYNVFHLFASASFYVLTASCVNEHVVTVNTRGYITHVCCEIGLSDLLENKHSAFCFNALRFAIFIKHDATCAINFANNKIHSAIDAKACAIRISTIVVNVLVL